MMMQCLKQVGGGGGGGMGIKLSDDAVFEASEGGGLN